MSDQRNTPPRSFPAPFDAHRVVAQQPSRPAVPVRPGPTVVAPPPGGGAEAARLVRTVDALRRLQATLTGAQQALDAVIVELQAAAGRRPAGPRATAGAGTPPPGRPVRRAGAELPAAPDVLAAHVHGTGAPDRGAPGA